MKLIINDLGVSDLEVPDLTREKIGTIINKINNQSGNWLGFKSKKEAIKFLTLEILGWDKNVDSLATIPNISQASKIIKESFNRCAKKVSSADVITIHLFPSYNKFINKKMGGINGYTPNCKNIILFVSQQKNWEETLTKTVAHEFAHTQSFSHNSWQTLLDSIIFEGLAEHFRESVVGGSKTPWVKSISETTAKKYFSQIENQLSSKNDEIYQELFFGQDNKYPLWTGYAIGYQVVKAYLKNNPNKSWLKIFSAKPKEILTKSNY